MTLTVVIPTRNAAQTVASQLEAIANQKCNESFEVIVADNGSTDGTRQIVEAYGDRIPHLKVVSASARPGAAHARNVGVQEASGEKIAFCDADDEVAPGWLDAMREGLSRHDFVASRVDLQKLNPPEIAETFRHPQANGLQQVSYPPYLYHAGGSGIGVKRSLHDLIGGFDETLPALEDTDYCFRLQLQGISLEFLHDAIVNYRFKHRQDALFHQARQWAQYNVLMYKRYRQNQRLVRPWRRHLSRWYQLVRSAPRALDRKTRPAWIKGIGTQVGLLQGAIKFGVPPVASFTFAQLTEALQLYSIIP